MKKIILASGSPRRRELLGQAQIDFDVIVSDVEEVITKELPGDIVEELSYIKANAVAKNHPETPVLGSDTVVVLDGKILGKPADEREAVFMLSKLQGRSHEVYTGVTFIEGDRVHSFHEKTEVFVYPMSKEEIQAYVETKEPMDKAGAYGIQGKFGVYIEKIHGDYNNVVGLPLSRVWHELQKFMQE